MSRITNSLAFSALLAGSLCSTVADATSCGYAPLNMTTSQTKTGVVSITIDGPAEPRNPTAWEGPIHVTRSGGTACSTIPEVSLIEAPLHFDGRHLLVTTYSGSGKMVYTVDAATCRVLSHTPAVEGRVLVTASALRVGGRVMDFDAACIPR